MAGWQQGLSPEQLAGPAAAAEPVMRPAGGAVAQDLAAAAVSAAGAMLSLRASAWMAVAVTAVALELPADLAAVAAAGVLALAAVQRARSGPAGSPSCCQRHDGTLMGYGMAVSIQQGWGTQADPSSARLWKGWVEGEAGPHGDPGPEHAVWQHAGQAPHQRGGLSAARGHCGAGVPWLRHGGPSHPHRVATGPPQGAHHSRGSCAWQSLASGKRRRLHGPHGA
uniref:Uncharacterized protein n=1 Tax=Equus caballus TaxID=9796 RepID=A0A9L0T237_HORSE